MTKTSLGSNLECEMLIMLDRANRGSEDITLCIFQGDTDIDFSVSLLHATLLVRHAIGLAYVLPEDGLLLFQKLLDALGSLQPFLHLSA